MFTSTHPSSEPHFPHLHPRDSKPPSMAELVRNAEPHSGPWAEAASSRSLGGDAHAEE